MENSATLVVCSLGDGYLMTALVHEDRTFQVLEVDKVSDIKILNVFVIKHRMERKQDQTFEITVEVLAADGRARASLHQVRVELDRNKMSKYERQVKKVFET